LIYPVHGQAYCLFRFKLFGPTGFAMFAMCCCNEDTESSNLNYTLPVHEEHPVQGTDKPGTETQVMVTQESCHARTQEQAMSSRSLSPEEKEVEKARLQQLVNTFAKKAVRGCPCTYINTVSKERFATEYRIDKSLEFLIILSPNDKNKPEITCPISGIEDIYSMAEDGQSCFPLDVLSLVPPEHRELLLMVVFRSGHDKHIRFCMTETTRESRDVFLECLRILCIYAQSPPSTSQQR